MQVLGIDIGGTNIRMGLVNEALVLSCFERQDCQELLQGDAVTQLTGAIRKYIQRTGADDIAAIASGVPGQVSRDRCRIYSVPQVQGLENIDLGRILSDEFGIPTYIAHDVDFLLTHDIQTMNLDPEHNRTIVAFYLGTGFGNALYINGAMHSGKHGVCGELGHTPLYGVKDSCSCGAIGCVETRCSGRRLAELTAQLFPDCHISDVFTKHGSAPQILDFVRDCALVMATEITILDPDYVLLGGGVVAMKDFPTSFLETEIRAHTRHPLPAEDIQFVYAYSGQSNGVVGGAMSAFRWLKQ